MLSLLNFQSAKRVIYSFIFLKAEAQILLNPKVDSIPMRDGKMLAADIYLPDTGQKYPVILIQTPYNRLLYRTGLPLGIGKNLKNSPYAFVIVDWRCFYGSAKACNPVPERGKDGYDVIDWIVKQNWSNGKVGTWGPSALGKIQYQTAKEQHPNHICAVPIVAGSQSEYQEYYPNGVLRTEYVEQLDALGYNLKNTILQHPYYDTWWQVVEKASMYPDKIKIPMLLIGGWFDHNIDQMFRMFDTLIKASDSSVRNLHKFLIGPWSHNTVGQKKAGDIEFPEAEGKSDSFALLFLDYWMRGAKNGWPLHPKYLLYHMEFKDPVSCYLIETDEWPGQYSAKSTLFFNDGGLWDVKQPVFSNKSRSFLYDPRDPSPTIGGPTLRPDLLQGPVNVESLLSRKDFYLLDTLYANGAFGEMRISGDIAVQLFVSSNRLDTDFAIRFGVIDQQHQDTFILSDGIFRMRFREGFSTKDTQAMNPGQIYPVSVKLPEIFCSIKHPFLPFLMISSSNYPRFDLNLNNGGELYTAGDTLVATNTVHTGKTYPSKIIFTGNIIAEGVSETKPAVPFVFPNPVQDQLNILMNNIDETFTFKIIDLQGKERMKGEFTGDHAVSIDISCLPPQVLILRIENEKVTYTTKILKI